MHSIYFEHFVDVSNHLTCLSALDLLFGACWTALHVVGVSLFCEAGERCQRTGFGYTAVMVAVVCMPGCGLGGI